MGFREGFQDGKTDFLMVPTSRAARYQFYLENMGRIRGCTAAFAVSDAYAAEFMHFIQENGILVPGEMSVVGFDDNTLCQNCFPQLTTVGQDAGRRADVAVRALKRLWEKSGGAMTEMLPVHLVLRGSVGRPKEGGQKDG